MSKFEPEVSREAILPKAPVDHLVFQSLSEYACARMLEKYTDWKAIPGATFQVQVGRASFDFLISNTLVEFHPISLRREFITENLRVILSATHRLNKAEKVKVLNAMADELRAQYDKRRKQVASAHPIYKECDVVCVFSQDEFISKVLYRFANKDCPTLEKSKSEFRALQKEGKLLLLGIK